MRNLASLAHILVGHLDGVAYHFTSVELSASQSRFWEGLVPSTMLNWPIFAVGSTAPFPFPLVAGPRASAAFLRACRAIGASLGAFGAFEGFLAPFWRPGGGFWCFLAAPPLIPSASLLCVVLQSFAKCPLAPHLSQCSIPKSGH